MTGERQHVLAFLPLTIIHPQLRITFLVSKMPSIDLPVGRVENMSGVAEHSLGAFPKPPKFTDKMKEREYLKFRLAQAFRIFGSLGYDEGVAGHITARVWSLLSPLQRIIDHLSSQDPVKTDCFWVNPFVSISSRDLS